MRRSSWRPIYFFVIFGDLSEVVLMRCLFVMFFQKVNNMADWVVSYWRLDLALG